MMSIVPASFTMLLKYWLTAASSSVSTTAACARPPFAVICVATPSTLDFVRPDKKTSAPAAANSLATAAPMVPAAPKTTACFPSRTGLLFITPPFSVSKTFEPCGRGQRGHLARLSRRLPGELEADGIEIRVGPRPDDASLSSVNDDDRGKDFPRQMRSISQIERPPADRLWWVANAGVL